jgi:hypothetical protein
VTYINFNVNRFVIYHFEEFCYLSQWPQIIVDVGDGDIAQFVPFPPRGANGSKDESLSCYICEDNLEK